MRPEAIRDELIHLTRDTSLFPREHFPLTERVTRRFTVSRRMTITGLHCMGLSEPR
ncbi:MAG: hypothetical protein Ct9H300mP16_00830 [Pseudomonadota bacterium]|nr:MAG: hypothetical protein Ct9H300mP16_00830 [Pseudomonadota bacterium]